MHALGKLLVVWGVLCPLLVFLACRGYDPAYDLLANIHQMYCFVGDAELSFVSILGLGLFMIGLGLSLSIVGARLRSRL